MMTAALSRSSTWCWCYLKTSFPVGNPTQDAISGPDTIDQLIKLHASLLHQPTARGTFSPSARA
jgi:hypothetical protein